MIPACPPTNPGWIVPETSRENSSAEEWSSHQINHSCPGKGSALEDDAMGGSRSPKKRSLAHEISEMIFLGIYFQRISQDQLWWLILPAGCNFSSAISVIYLLSYPKVVLYYFIVYCGSVSRDWTQPHETGHSRTLSHLSKGGLVSVIDSIAIRVSWQLPGWEIITTFYLKK